MSLQLAAQHLSDQGRGPDDTLVHMSRNEVKSLNDLAMAHGGQLTINPETGLPEAGFLSSMLPMIAGAALASTGVGAPMAAMLVGGGSYLMNPEKGLMGGLMAGLGAYGGYGLGEGLGSIATSEAGSTAANAATTAAEEGAKQEMARAQAQAQAQKLAESKYIDPNFLDVGGSGSNYLPTGSGGANVIPPASSATDQLATIKSNIANEYMAQAPIPRGFDAMYQGAKSIIDTPTADKFKALGGGSWTGLARTGLAATAPAMAQQTQLNMPAPTSQKSIAPRYKFNPGMATPTPGASPTGVENTYFSPQYTAISDEEAKNIYGFAGGGPVETMSNQNAMGANTMYPMANMTTSSFATPYQSPISTNMLAPTSDSGVGMNGEPNMQGTRLAEGGETSAAPAYTYDAQAQKYMGGTPTAPMVAGIGAGPSMAYDPQTQRYTGGIIPQDQIYLGGGQWGLNKAGREAEAAAAAASGAGMAKGGIADAGYNLGGYSDGGRLLRGPGDGVSDSIPAVIGKKQPARLADGEFVVPARIVSELGNGSTEAGARRLYAMMDRIQSARGKTVGKGKVAKNTRADKYLPA
jgi:hypothetical protein